MQYKGHKMIYILLGIFGILIAFFMIKGCAYPTSYRAFIPKALDSEYKEYERLCKEEIGKVVYARVQQGIEIQDIEEKNFMWFLPNKSIVLQMLVLTNSKTKREFYMKIIGFYYYTKWNRFHPEFFIMPHYKRHYIYKGVDLNDVNYANVVKDILFEAMANNQNVGKDFNDESGFSSFDDDIINVLFGGKK